MALFDFLIRKPKSIPASATDTYQSLAQKIIVFCEKNPQKALLYAEVSDGVISADLFFSFPSEKIVNFRFAPKYLKDDIYEFWRVGDEKIKPCSWATLSFIVENGQFKVAFMYPDQLDPNEELSDRRPRKIVEYFPDLPVDYSRPNG